MFWPGVALLIALIFSVVGVSIWPLRGLVVFGLRSPAGGPLTASEYVRLLGVGINVDWLTFRRVNEFYFMWRGEGINVPAVFRIAGFRNVRIRVSGDVVGNASLLREVREVVDDCLRAGLIPVLTYTADEVRVNPTDSEAQEHFIRWWATVAEALRDEPYTLSYDLMIESSHNIRDYPGILNKLYAGAIEAIRKVDKFRVIILTAPDSSSPFHLNELKLPEWGKYIIVEWHVYAGGPCPKKGVKEPYNKTLIREAIAAALNWSERTGVPTWVGAWRPNCYLKHGKQKLPDGAPEGILPEAEALNFTRFMAEELRRAGIPYDINADELFLNYETLNWYPSQERILEAALNPTGVSPANVMPSPTRLWEGQDCLTSRWSP